MKEITLLPTDRWPLFSESEDSGKPGSTREMWNELDQKVTYICPDCGAPMTIIDTFVGGQLPRGPPRLSGGRS